MTQALRVLVTGAAGMLGRKLCARLAREGRLGARPIATLIMPDLAPLSAPAPARCRVETRRDDLPDRATGARLIALAPDVALHLAATIERGVEASFEEGYAINFDAARRLFEAVRLRRRVAPDYFPRVVVTSSIGVYGPPFPAVVEDDFILQPQTSYGAQKAMVELLLADYVRKGHFDGVAIRLPTIAVRPDRAHAGLTDVFSHVVREPLRGLEARLPARLDAPHWLASPRAAVGYAIHAASMDTAPLGPRRALTMPGVSATLREEVEALRRVGGAAALALLKPGDDPRVEAMIAHSPARFSARRALGLGFTPDRDVDAILRAFVEDDLVAAPALTPAARGA